MKKYNITISETGILKNKNVTHKEILENSITHAFIEDSINKNKVRYLKFRAKKTYFGFALDTTFNSIGNYFKTKLDEED